MLVEQEVGRSAGGVVEEGDYSVWGDPAWHRVGLDLRTGWVGRGQTSYSVAIPFGAGVFFEDPACVGHGSERIASSEMGAFVKLQSARNSALLGR